MEYITKEYTTHTHSIVRKKHLIWIKYISEKYYYHNFYINTINTLPPTTLHNYMIKLHIKLAY